MEIEQALFLLSDYLTEIDTLRALRHGNDKSRLWLSKVNVVLEAAFGKNSDEYQKVNARSPITIISFDDADQQRDYLRDLSNYEIGIREILQKFEILGKTQKSRFTRQDVYRIYDKTKREIESAQSMSTRVLPDKPSHDGKPKVFVAHGGESPALRNLNAFLKAVGVEPIVVEEQASEHRSLGQNVDWYSRQCECAVILATKGDIDAKTGGFLPRGNVLVEAGKLDELYSGRVVYLLQSGTKFPTNINEKVWERFTPQSMGKAFTKVARELSAFGVLKAQKLNKE